MECGSFDDIVCVVWWQAGKKISENAAADRRKKIHRHSASSVWINRPIYAKEFRLREHFFPARFNFDGQDMRTDKHKQHSTPHPHIPTSPAHTQAHSTLTQFIQGRKREMGKPRQLPRWKLNWLRVVYICFSRAIFILPFDSHNSSSSELPLRPRCSSFRPFHFMRKFATCELWICEYAMEYVCHTVVFVVSVCLLFDFSHTDKEGRRGRENTFYAISFVPFGFMCAANFFHIGISHTQHTLGLEESRFESSRVEWKFEFRYDFCIVFFLLLLLRLLFHIVFFLFLAKS